MVIANPTPHFRFRFVSDIEGSSEDGLYPAGEGWVIDDVTVKGGVSDIRFFDDMESGMGTWTRSTFPPVGDYWKIVSNPLTQQVCTTNTGKVWQVTDNVTGALVPRLDDKLVSPAVAVNRSDQVFLVLEVRVHRPLGEAGGVGHLVERGGGEPLLGEDPGGCLDEALAGLGLLLFPCQSLAGGHAPFWGAGGVGVRSSSRRRWNRS